MNRTNVGANTNTLQILLDVFVVAVACAMDLLIFGKNMGQEQQVYFLIVIGVFALIYVLAKHLYISVQRVAK